MSREENLRRAYDLVVQTTQLRPPQAQALAAVRDMLLRLPAPLREVSQEQAQSFLADDGKWHHAFHPVFTLNLATGVGKSRLAGAIMAMLWLSNEARTFVLLAPRRAVLQRLEAALDPQFRDYLFVDPGLVPEPTVILADDLQTARAVDFDPDAAPVIFLLSQQVITTSERFTGQTEFADMSPLEALRQTDGVVVIADEAHHIGKVAASETTAWGGAIRRLEPALQLGLTATPRTDLGVNVLYSYPLPKALQDGHFTKKVKLIVRPFDGAVAEDDIDRSAIDFTLMRLKAKEAALTGASNERLRATKPVAVLFARDIAHATSVRNLLVEAFGVDGEEVLLTHSKMSKSEEELERLLGVEDPANRVRVIVNVMELTEGWDVRNVYVVTPLRAMATFTGAVQAMGRGLRLPAGRRVGDAEGDTLDVVCFGRDTLARIAEEATTWSGASTIGAAGVEVRTPDDPDSVTKVVPVAVARPLEITYHDLRFIRQEMIVDLEPEALARVTETVVESFELGAAAARVGKAGSVRLPRDRFVSAAADRALRRLADRLTDVDHRAPLVAIVEKWLTSVRPDAEMIDFDPAEVGEEIAKALRDGAKTEQAAYQDSGRIVAINIESFNAAIEAGVDEGVQAVALPVDLDDFERGRLYGPWQQAVHDAYTFDARPEAKLAQFLDSADDVDWWFRNQPRRLRLTTPIGLHSPDFVAGVKRPGQSDLILLLEAKGDVYWSPPSGDANLKAAAARRWVEEQSAVDEKAWHATVALESSILAATSFADLERHLIPRLPERPAATAGGN